MLAKNKIVAAIMATEVSTVEKGSTAIVYAAVQHCVSSDILKLTSVEAVTAMTLCKDFCINFDFNHREVETACSKIVSTLSKCIPSLSNLPKRWREKMWKDFHSARSTAEFRSVWCELFSETIGITVSIGPLYQHLTDTIFHNLLEPIFTQPVQQSVATDSSPCISDNEENALRYIAGYILHKVKKRVSASKHALKKELMRGVDYLIDKKDSDSGSAQWVQSLDRGGLCKVTEEAHTLFYELEILVRKLTGEMMNSDFRREALSAMRKEDDDVMFVWRRITAEMGTPESDYLFARIANLFITIRGNSFATSIMERYKQSARKKVQKSKGMRKKVNTD